MKIGLKMCLVVLLTSAVFISCDKDDDENGNAWNDVDENFALMAAMSNHAEITAGQSASTKAENDGIREFGQMMVSDHTDARQDLRDIVDDLGLHAPDSLDALHVRIADTLGMLTGRAFDSVYINSQVRDHLMAISLFQNEAANGQNAQLRAYATRLLPSLQMHLHHADSLANDYD